MNTNCTPTVRFASFKLTPIVTTKDWLKAELQKGGCYPFFFSGGNLGGRIKNPSIRYYEASDFAATLAKTVQVLSALPGVTVLEGDPAKPSERQFTVTRNGETVTWDLGTVEPHNVHS